MSAKIEGTVKDAPSPLFLRGLADREARAAKLGAEAKEFLRICEGVVGQGGKADCRVVALRLE